MKKVLVVDDSQVVRGFHGNLLKSAGFKVETAVDGADALEKALRKEFDLILTDLNMPNMDGLTFIKKYRDENRETPIIIISTQEEASHKKKGYEAGANLYIVKPVKPNTLVMHIKMLSGMLNNGQVT
ncbi:MAG: response regulator [Thermodesulfovibrionales bacterium]|nr:response regulator [Thermodesulfovibrionales bacterium]